ncbi:uncharacterized protein LOC105633398 [Jatropha curcas]|uniref:uncharacterized protein LOC105633398 n=1 Tax=Jatropha curcas TaxID=180498 RepID=UPI0009D6F163|nr:uncharacterized protein LOC105633398 [Jatropha curcas]
MLNFSICIKMGDNVRLQITEAPFSAQQGRDDHNLCIPWVEVVQSMKYRTSSVSFQGKSGKMDEYVLNFRGQSLGPSKLDSKYVFLGYESFDHKWNFTRVSFHVDYVSVNYSGKGEVISGRMINCGIHSIYWKEYRKAKRRNERRKESDKDIVEAANTELWEKNSRQKL